MGCILEKHPAKKRLGKYQSLACHILNGITRRMETTIQALTGGPIVKPKPLQPWRQSNKPSRMRPHTALSMSPTDSIEKE